MTDRDDPRTKAALERRCGVCGAGHDDECATPTGVVHQIRVPEKVLLGKELQ